VLEGRDHRTGGDGHRPVAPAHIGGVRRASEHVEQRSDLGVGGFGTVEDLLRAASTSGANDVFRRAGRDGADIRCIDRDVEHRQDLNKFRHGRGDLALGDPHLHHEGQQRDALELLQRTREGCGERTAGSLEIPLQDLTLAKEPARVEEKVPVVRFIGLQEPEHGAAVSLRRCRRVDGDGPCCGIQDQRHDVAQLGGIPDLAKGVDAVSGCFKNAAARLAALHQQPTECEVDAGQAIGLNQRVGRLLHAVVAEPVDDPRGMGVHEVSAVGAEFRPFATAHQGDHARVRRRPQLRAHQMGRLPGQTGESPKVERAADAGSKFKDGHRAGIKPSELSHHQVDNIR